MFLRNIIDLFHNLFQSLRSTNQNVGLKNKFIYNDCLFKGNVHEFLLFTLLLKFSETSYLIFK
jgi:sRNA-binding regulator protein Hfq